jgi:hypothetical protein
MSIRVEGNIGKYTGGGNADTVETWKVVLVTGYSITHK